MNKSLWSIILISFTLTSCCTLKHQAAHPVHVSSNVPEAQVVVDGSYHGTTPITVRVDPRYSHLIVLQKEGYQTESYEIPSELSGKKMAGNFTFPLVGALVGGGAGLYLLSQPVGAFAIPFAIGGLVIGTAIGSAGAVIDVASGKARTIRVQRINAELIVE